MGETEDEPLSLNLFQDLIKEWDTDHVQNNYDPTEILHKMADILEKETNVYMASDPDPFEERHPSRVDPECQLGLLLKAYFKKESLVQEVFNHYMKENYFTRAGLDQSSFNLNVSACRLVLDILPGLEIGVLNDTDGLISQLYKWVSGKLEPLCSYATGLLAVAMELNEVATEAEIREKNSKLVPEMLARLRELQDEAEKERDQARSDRFKRPFALFSKSPLKNPRRLSAEGEVDGVGKLSNGIVTINGGSGGKDQDGELVLGAGGKKETGGGGGCKKSLERSGSGTLAPGWPNGIMSPPRSSTENSSSSWAEMELNVIGHFEIFPVSLQASQIFILRLLTPLAEYQDFLSLTQGSRILEVLERYINVRETRDARLAFEALKLLASLFCHKKFTLEWVATGGLSLLMQMPRPSMAATGSSLCLYYLACDDDTMEKICSLPPHTLQDLVKYCLWLLECSHETGRQYSIMFFGLAFPFRTILDIFDASDGLRKLYNTISTLSIISDRDDDRDSMSDDQEFMQRQSVRYTTQSLKKYVEAHLAIRVEEEISSDLTRAGGSPQPPHPSYKPYRLEQEQVTEHIFTLLELMNYRGRWEPIDRLIKLGGIQLLLQVIALSYDWTYAGRAETVKCGLDVLAVCSVIPRVQLALCEKFDLPDESAVGINIVLGTAEGEIVPDSPEVQRAALLVLCHLLCGPVVRPGCVKHTATPTPSKRRGGSDRVKSSDEVINKVWECVRANNGIMALLQLMQTKAPLTDADSIRALACRALVGLARSSTATQIMSKLPIFNNGVLNMLLREPVLQDKRAEHVKFQKHAHELIEKVSGPMSRKNYENNDITLDMLHRASVVANTRIRYNNKQLLQLMHEHLVLSGLNKTAEVLKNESDFVPLVDSSGGSVPPVYPVRSMISFHPSHLNRRMISSPTPSRPISTPSRQITSIPSSRPNHTATSRQQVTTPTRPLPTTNTNRSTTSTSIPIRVNRPTRTSVPTTPTPATRSAMKTMDASDQSTSKALEQVGDTKHEVSLGSIVSDFLSSQHALCRNPMTTCPEFDLLLPHKCPDQRSRRAAPLNFTSRYSKKSLFPPYGGPDGSKLDRKLVYSRFRPVKSFRAGGDDREENVFTSCAFSGDSQFLFAGTYMGDVKMYNLQSSEETTYQCHDSYVYHVQPSRDSKLVITSSSWRTPYSKLWSVGDFFDEKKQFKDEEYLEFSCNVQDKVVGTQSDAVATIYDLHTGQLSRTLKPTSSNGYSRNRATFDPTDDLILSDGVLWDYRAPRQIHKFDKLNQTLSGVFHPNGLEIISNTEVWDIRTFHLLRTVPQLDQCQIVFNSGGEVIFGLNLEQELEDETKFETAFKTFDASDYSLIATIETKKSVLGLCSSWDDQSLAVVEQGNGECVESAVRMYDVGRLRAEEEDQEDDGEDEDGGPDDDDSDGSSDGMGGGDDNDDEYGEDLSGSGSGTPSEDDLDDPDDEVDADEVEDLDDDDGGTIADDDDSWEDIEVEEEVGGD
eukprot:GFUD01125193.1.p1 GENE.GFUD01125193.1~~GFUD01125193.1.p1  ORF type:complete len:1498 (-),score=483.98 GFUD01125193.1:148-4641(-)